MCHSLLSQVSNRQICILFQYWYWYIHGFCLRYSVHLLMSQRGSCCEEANEAINVPHPLLSEDDFRDDPMDCHICESHGSVADQWWTPAIFPDCSDIYVQNCRVAARTTKIFTKPSACGHKMTASCTHKTCLEMCLLVTCAKGRTVLKKVSAFFYEEVERDCRSFVKQPTNGCYFKEEKKIPAGSDQSFILSSSLFDTLP